MPYLSSITHDNLNTQEKVNFFSDYFYFANNQLGLINELSFENPLSIVIKIIYQIEFNLKNSTPYLENYFSSTLLDLDGFISLFPSAHECSVHICNYNSIKKVDLCIKYITDNPSFLNSLKKLKEELEKSMIEEALTILIRCLRCSHKLEKHIKEIKFLTNLIVTEFRFKGHSEKDVATFIAKIMSKDIYEFPFPKRVNDQTHAGNYKELRKEFIDNRNFQEQFEGIKNLFEKDMESSFFVFRVYNFSNPEKQDFQSVNGDVIFSSPENRKFTKMRKIIQKKVFSKDFFDPTDEFILAYTQVNYFSLDLASLAAINRIEHALKIINDKLGSNGVLDKNFFLLTNNFNNVGANRKFTPKILSLSSYDIKKLETLSSRIKAANPQTRELLTRLEDSYQAALVNKDMAKLWEYLEKLIPLDCNGKKQIKKIVSNILLLTHKKTNSRLLRIYVYNAVNNYNPELLGFSHEEFIKISKDPLNFYPLKYKKNIQRPFLLEIIKLLQRQTSSKYFNEYENYYYSILTETYELRNIKTHVEASADRLETKIVQTFPRLVLEFRNVLFDEVKKQPSASLSKVIEDLYNRSLALKK